jgi:eukaryotic-like serine/threonine-protein kinase
MGIVYKAEDLTLGRFVAPKFLPQNVAKEPHALSRFQREAKAASALNHPGICTIYEIDEQDGHAFIAMEYLEGMTLKHLISVCPIATDVVFALAIDAIDPICPTEHKREQDEIDSHENVDAWWWRAVEAE